MSAPLSNRILEAILESPFAGETPSVYCDLDGVLANFYAGMEKYIGVPQKNVNHFLTNQDGWAKIEKKEPHLFAKLPMLPDAKGLMNGLLSFRDKGQIDLYILTAIPDEWASSPTMRKVAILDKVQWVTRHFQKIPARNVIVVRREEKQNYAQTHIDAGDPPPVLIDDYGKNITEWESAGGFGIKHTGSMSSLRALYTYLE